MSAVWVVSKGTYSDYRVMCACRSKADASAVAAKYNASDSWASARVERLPIIGADVERVAVLSMTTTLWDNGEEADSRESMQFEWPFDSYRELAPVRWRWVRGPIHKGKGGRLDVHGIDIERVRRVFSDKRAEIMATPALRIQQEAKG